MWSLPEGSVDPQKGENPVQTHPLQITFCSSASAANESRLRGNHHITGRVKKFHEPINVVLIYSNVEVGRVQRLDFDILSRSIAF